MNFDQPQSILFLFFAGIMISSSLIVILHKNPIVSAVFLVLSFFSLAGIYAVMNAIFIATMQVLVYAGAIMVLVIFVLMLLSLREETHKEIWNQPVKKSVIVFIVLFYAFLLLSAILSINSDKAPKVAKANSNYEYVLNQDKNVVVKGNSATVGAATFMDYLLPFELISVLLLAAVIGAVILAKKDFKELTTNKHN